VVASGTAVAAGLGAGTVVPEVSEEPHATAMSKINAVITATNDGMQSILRLGICSSGKFTIRSTGYWVNQILGLKLK
jgi:hypothetical protein